jgi:hypothetical protein
MILMTPNLREFISARKAEIQGQMKLLRQEMQELRAAEDAITNAPTTKSGAPSETEPQNPGKLTIKDMVVRVLSETGKGMDALKLMENVKGKFGVEVQRTSLSPQLSRLKSEGILVMENKVWSLTSQTSQKTEGSNAATSEPSPESQECGDIDILG